MGSAEMYLQQIRRVERGQVTRLNDGAWMVEDRCSQLVVDPGQRVHRADIYNLPSMQCVTGNPYTPQESYGICARSVFEGERQVGCVRITDSRRELDSSRLADETIRAYGDNHLKKIDITDYRGHFSDGRFWDFDFQRQFGRLDGRITYVVCGLEKLSREELGALFSCPDFEARFEHYQEQRGRWEGVNYSHNLFLLAVGSADVAIEMEMRPNEKTMQTLPNGQIICTGFVGGMINFFDRINKTSLFCVDDDVPL